MVLGSKYGADAQGGLDVVGYFVLEWVPKPTPSGVKLIRRDPAPEVLIGDPVFARAAMRAAPGDLKYRSLVFSFAHQDMNVGLVNAGCPDSRTKIDFTLQIFCEVAFAGIPETCRPPLFVTTHTHTGRLELNVMIPRWVRRPDGELRSFNPDPPRRGSRACWVAFEDLLNARFGWADPRDPANQRLITLPSWLLKQKAEALRSGAQWEPTVRERVMDELATAVTSGAVKDRSELLKWIEDWCAEHDMVVHTTGSAHVTIGAQGADVKDRIRLKGLLFSTSKPFSTFLNRTIPTVEQRRVNLEDACTRLQEAVKKRAAFNRSRYGLGRWPDPQFDAEVFALGPLSQTPKLIPPIRIVRTAEEPNNDDSSTFSRPSEPDRIGAGIAPESGGVGSAPGRATGAAGSEDRGAGGGDQGRAGSSHPLVPFADMLAGPNGPGRIISALARRASKVLPKLSAGLALRRVAAAIPDHLPKTLNHCSQALEKLNVTLTKTAHAVTAGQYPTHASRRGGPETRSDSARDHAAPRSASGAGKVGTDADGAPDRGHGRPRVGSRQSSYVSGGSEADRRSRPRDAGAADRVRSFERAPRSNGKAAQHPEQLAGGANGELCRADIIRHILSLCDEVDPGCPRSLRWVTEADLDDPRMSDALTLSFGPEEHWALCASLAARTAVANDARVQIWTGEDIGPETDDAPDFGF